MSAKANPRGEPVDVCALEDLADGGVSEIRVGRRRAAAARLGENVYVFADRCPHRGGPLCEGLVTYPLTADVPGEVHINRVEPVVMCPWHGWEFKLETGEALPDGSLRMKVFATEVRGERVFVQP